MSSHPTHQFADATHAQIPVPLRSTDYELLIKQEPNCAKVAVGKEKDRKPVDPPPIIQLVISKAADPTSSYLQSPYFFMSCSLVAGSETGAPQGTLGTALAGTLVSSLHRLKDISNEDGAFFVFGDLSAKIEGTFRLQFNLYEMRGDACFHVGSVESKTFVVYSTKNFPGMAESTFLTRSFSDQGVRLRLRKEPRTLLRKRGPAHDDYQPRHYRTGGNRQDSQGAERQNLASPDSQSAPRQIEQGEPVESNQVQSYEHSHPQVGRHFPQQSPVSFSGSSYEGSSKRPRTGSEHDQSPSFAQQQNQPLASPQYPPQQSFNPYPQQSHQQPNYGFSYTQSPQTTTPRDQYYGRLATTQSMSPYSQTRSPDENFFPPQGLRVNPPPQGSHYGLGNMMTPSGLPRVETSFGDLGLSGRPQISPVIGSGQAMPGMVPPIYGRMNTTPTYGSLPGSALGRRETFQGYTGAPPNLSMNSMDNFLGTRGPTTNSTTAPGTLDSSF